MSNVAKLPNVTVLPFIEDMASAYKAADLVVCRAGALTISELSLVVKAAILVPSPNVAEDHQTKNAKALVDKGAAQLIKDEEAEEELIHVAIQLINDEDVLQEMAEKAGELAKENAAEKIANEILALIK